jgi:CO/xanthine dehydrogenase FAD-binding subunit
VRAYLPSYEMKSAKSLEDALNVLSEAPGVWRPFAGGTDLMVLFEAGKLAHKKFISIWGIPELSLIQVYPDRIELGALTTYSQLQKNEVMQKEFPNLTRSSFETGSIAIQNRGTLGGNIANASPAADSSPGLLAYDAIIELISKSGKRQIPYREFHLAYKKTQLRPDELVSKILLPRVSEKKFHYFRKVGTRKAQAISKICISGVATRDHGIKVGFGSVGPVPILLELENKKSNQSDQQWLDAGIESLKKLITPIDDIRSTAAYRLNVSANLLSDFLKLASREF